MDPWKKYVESLEALRKLNENARRSPYAKQARRRATLQIESTAPVVEMFESGAPRVALGSLIEPVSR